MICNKCNIDKDIKCFEWQKDRPNPRKKCTKCRTDERVFTENQKIKQKEYKKKYRDSGRAQEVWENHKYGISKKDIGYSVCVICNDTHRLSIDHDHSTGEFRGLLCSSCNTAIGLFKENIQSMESAIKYLEHFKSGGEPFKDYPHYELKK